MHDYFEIEMIVAGQGIEILNGDAYSLKRGTMYFLSPIDFHGIKDQSELKLLNISFDGSIISGQLLNTLISRSHNLIFELSEEEIEEVEFFTSMLLKEFCEDDVYSELNIKNILASLLVFILRRTDPSSGHSEEQETEPIYRCMRYLFLHFNEAPSLEKMSLLSGYSANYFSKQFHDITGKKYVDFLRSLRLNYAKQLLIATKKPILEISAECGFASLSNFNHVFKKEVGQSPSQYRRYKSQLL